MDTTNIKEQLAECGRGIAQERWVIARGGNLSVRVDDTVYIKTRGSRLLQATPDDFVAVNVHSGDKLEDGRDPSIELDTHLVCYQNRPDIHAVVHAHPTFATCIATAGVGLGPVTTELASCFPSGIARISYKRPGSAELAEAIAAAVKDNDGILLSHHGAITVGKDLDEAFISMQILEESAKIAVLGNAVGTIQPLKPQQVQDLLTFYK